MKTINGAISPGKVANKHKRKERDPTTIFSVQSNRIKHQQKV